MTATFSYDITTNVGKVRFLVPDRGPIYPDDDFLFSDEEIAACLSLEGGNVYRAAAAVVESATGYQAARLYGFKDDQVEVKESEIVKNLAAHAKALRVQGENQLGIQRINVGIEQQDYIRPEGIFAELQPGEH